MFNWDGWHLDAQHFGGALRVVTRCGDNMLGSDDNLLITWHKVAAFFDHFGASDFPMGTSPMERIRLHLTHDFNATLTRAFCHRHGHIGRVYVPVFGVVDGTFQIVGADKRPTLFNLLRAQPFVIHAASFCSRSIEHVFIHTLISLCHTKVTYDGKPRVKAGFLFQRFIEIDRVLVDVGRRVGHVEQRQ